jgi:hypothetical protein
MGFAAAVPITNNCKSNIHKTLTKKFGFILGFKCN